MLLVQGLVVTYSGSGTLNLAHGAVAMVGGYLYWQLRFVDAWSTGTAILATVAVCAVIGGLSYQLVIRPLARASEMTRVAATVGLLVMLQGIVELLWGTQPKEVVEVFPVTPWHLAGVTVPPADIWMLVTAGILTIVLGVGLRATRWGLAIRATADSVQGVATLGWSPHMLATVTWSLGGALAGAAGLLIAPLVGLSVDEMPLLIIPALAAGLIGSFRSLPLTFVGGICIGITQSLVTGYTSTIGLDWTIPFAAIVVILVAKGKGVPTRGQLSERRPAVGSGKRKWWLVIPSVGVSLFLLGNVFGPLLLSALTVSLASAIVMLSAVVLLGYTGQLSFEQMAMAGLAALVAVRLENSAGVPFGLAALGGIAAAVPVGVAFALPALRTRGVNLAVVTLGLGTVVYEVVFSNPTLTGGGGIPAAAATSLFGIDINPVTRANAYAILTFIVFVICVLGVTNIRRGRAGRAMIAVRTNERAAGAMGINVVQAKLFAFVVGATVAAIGGILLAFQNTGVDFGTLFTPFQSMLVVAYVVLGGVGYAIGPLQGMMLVIGGFGSWVLYEIDSGTASGSYWLVLIAGVSVLLTIVLHQDGVVHLQTRAASEIAERIGRKLKGARGARMTTAQPDPALRALPLQRLAVVKPRSLEVRDVVVRFGAVIAVDGVSLVVNPGEVVGLIGPNGAGKTTVMDAVSGLVRHARGEIRLGGERIDTWPPHRRARAGLSRSFQSLELFEDSTLFDNLMVATDGRRFSGYAADVIRPRSMRLPAAAVAAVEKFRLGVDLDKRMSELSYGRRRISGTARAVAAETSILLLDEPAAGLTSQERHELAAEVRELARERGQGVLVVEHDIGFVMSLCERIIVLDFGRVIAEGSPDEIRSNPKVIAAYLGATDDAHAMRSAARAQ